MNPKEESYQLFLKDVFVSDDLKDLTRQIDSVLDIIYFDDKKTLMEKLTGKLPGHIFDIIASLFAKKILSGNPKVVEEYFISLNSYLSKIPKVILTIAFKPSGEFLKTLSFWFEKNLGKKVVCDIRVREEIIAGALVEYRGKYKDYSRAKLIPPITLNPR